MPLTELDSISPVDATAIELFIIYNSLYRNTQLASTGFINRSMNVANC